MRDVAFNSGGDAIPGVGGIVPTANGHSAAPGPSEGPSGAAPPSGSGARGARVKYAYQRPVCLQLFTDEEIQVCSKGSSSCSKVVNTVAPQIGYSSRYEVVLLAVGAKILGN